jgi:PTS system nitrogen regulatory IIA component
MLLASLLNPNFIHLKSEMSTKAEVIQHLLLHFQKSSPAAFDLAAVRAAVEQRESLGGTVFPTGIAVPHARLEGFEDLLIGICVPRQPIQLEGIAVRMLVLILTSKVASPIYLTALAALLKLSQDQPLFESLLEARSAHEFLATMERAGVTVRKKVTVADVMSPEVARVAPQASLRELVDMMYRQGESYAAVVGSDGAFLGEVRVLDLLRVGLPQYTSYLENLRFLESFAPLEALTQKEDTLAVSEIMNKAPPSIGLDTPIVEAVFELTHKNLDCLAVVEKGKLVGRLCASEILRRIVRG